jgi:membrane protein implicated in regulation of membrane protease activity
MFSSAFWWVLVGIGLMICEFAVPGLILFFFGLGALVTALLASIFPMSLTVELAVFVVASLVSLFGLRLFLKPIFTGRATAVQGDAPSDGLDGEEGRVSVEILPEIPGKIMLHGTAWKAESEESLAEGQSVVVVGQRSLTLIVKSK